MTGYEITPSGDKQAVIAQQATQQGQIGISDQVGAESVDGTIPDDAPEIKAINTNNPIVLNQTEGQHLGSTTVANTPNGPEFLISLFDGANLSTLLHETGHIFYEEMERVVLDGEPSQGHAQSGIR